VGHSPLPPLPPRSPHGDADAQAVSAEPPPLASAGAIRPPDEDLRLVRRLVTGDALAWRTLVERFQRLVLARVLATARELNRPIGPSDAEDLSAEVFSRLVADDYAALRRFEGRSTLSTWLCVITRRIALRRLSIAVREPSRPTAHAQSFDTLPGPATQEPLVTIISDEDRALLAAGMAQLGERHQQLARLFYVDGCSYRQISEQLQMPINSIGPTLARIHEKLRTAMKQGE
jgi:RNA polymerase sigma-70 factor (ECF subfamily)